MSVAAQRNTRKPSRSLKMWTSLQSRMSANTQVCSQCPKNNLRKRMQSRGSSGNCCGLLSVKAQRSKCLEFFGSLMVLFFYLGISDLSNHRVRYYNELDASKFSQFSRLLVLSYKD